MVFWVFQCFDDFGVVIWCFWCTFMRLMLLWMDFWNFSFWGLLFRVGFGVLGTLGLCLVSDCVVFGVFLCFWGLFWFVASDFGAVVCFLCLYRLDFLEFGCFGILLSWVVWVCRDLGLILVCLCGLDFGVLVGSDFVIWVFWFFELFCLLLIWYFC